MNPADAVDLLKREYTKRSTVAKSATHVPELRSVTSTVFHSDCTIQMVSIATSPPGSSTASWKAIAKNWKGKRNCEKALRSDITCRLEPRSLTSQIIIVRLVLAAPTDNSQQGTTLPLWKRHT